MLNELQKKPKTSSLIKKKLKVKLFANKDEKKKKMKKEKLLQQFPNTLIHFTFLCKSTFCLTFYEINYFVKKQINLVLFVTLFNK